MRRLFVFALLSFPISAATITDVAFGSHLAGGFVTVTFFGGPMATGTFAGPGTATFFSTFTLTVTPGTDTTLADWTLRNDDAGPLARSIVSVTFDLTLSSSLFDNDSLPSTPGSGPGRSVALFVAGAPIASTTFVNPWPDPLNTGDLFRGATVAFGGGGIAPGAVATFRLDTDTTAVPEPSLTPLVALVLVALAKGRVKNWSCG